MVLLHRNDKVIMNEPGAYQTTYTVISLSAYWLGFANFEIVMHSIFSFCATLSKVVPYIFLCLSLTLFDYYYEY